MHATAQERHNVVYGPDVLKTVEVEETSRRLLIGFVEDDPLDLAQGEWKEARLWVSNQGTREVDELWLVCGPEDEIWVSSEDTDPPGRCIFLIQDATLSYAQLKRRKDHSSPRNSLIPTTL